MTVHLLRHFGPLSPCPIVATSLRFFPSPLNAVATRTRTLTCSVPAAVKRVEVDEGDGDVTVVRGVVQESPRKGHLVSVERRAGDCGRDTCHPLCRWEHNHKIKHTDVLILDQFVEGSGNVIPRFVTGLCNRQHYRITKLVKMAQKAGLMPAKDYFAKEKENEDGSTPWAKLNTYWDDSTPDKQWIERLRKDKIKSFRT